MCVRTPRGRARVGAFSKRAVVAGGARGGFALLLLALLGCSDNVPTAATVAHLQVYASILGACGGQELAIVSLPQKPPTPSPVRFASEKRDFASLRNVKVSLETIDGFIDSRITGRQRADVLAVMERIAPDKRRNFGFAIEGRVYSNNLERLKQTSRFITDAVELHGKAIEVVFWPSGHGYEQCGS